jgi:tRNA/tmRNA/rRNA uracil-C5-methylase (TrmA/RlmC/RlmD family)
MSLVEGQQVELTIEKPASGGRMIARHLGQIVLVRGAIPGERVRAWIERAEKRMAYAVTREVVEPSPDRREAGGDPLCGGALYSHIAYRRQLAIKSDVIRDAFARLGQYPIEHPIDVAGSPEEGYRMRARFHVAGARAGFYREGTHQLCDAAATKQLSSDAVAAAARLAAALDREVPGAAVSIALAENIAGDQRVAHVELAPRARAGVDVLARVAAEASLAGISARDMETGQPIHAGTPVITDPLAAIAGEHAGDATLQRHAESFFQGNRFLLPVLVTAVAEATPDSGHVLDLYAGVGLFSVALAALGRLEITAVEGDRASGADLRENARAQSPRLVTHIESVEGYVARFGGKAPATLIVDPPRTGLSKEAAAGILRLAAGRLVYVSCDPPTLARDARRLLDAGYTLHSVRAFDLFPNTPHVETLAIFTRYASNS